MAARLIIFVLATFLVNLFTSEVQAANSTATPSLSATAAAASSSEVVSAQATSTAASAASTQIKPTATATTSAPSASPTVPSSDRFVTTLKAVVTYDGECHPNKTKKIKEGIKDLYKDQAYDLNADIQAKEQASDKKCMFNLTVIFNKGLTGKTDIISKFENASKTGIGGMKLTVISAEVHVDGAEQTEYKPSKDNCVKICCDGGGGEIEVVRTCKPDNKCVNYRLKKTVSNCLDVCDKDYCSSAGMSLHFSLMVFVLGGLLNWVLKE